MSIKTQLNEALLDESEIVQADLSKYPGVLARVRRTICEIDEPNANKRIYRRSLWEKVFNDSEFKRKLEARQILGNTEHPKDTQVKYDKDNNSHIVSKMYIAEAFDCPIRKRKIVPVKAEFDLLENEAGQFILTLHRAGVKVTASTRAEGALKPLLTESDEKLFEVDENSYLFHTIDHTGDASCFTTEPEAIFKATRESYNEKKISPKTAVVLLENINTDAAKQLCESIKQEIDKIQISETYRNVTDEALVAWVKDEEKKPEVNKKLVDLLKLEMQARGICDKPEAKEEVKEATITEQIDIDHFLANKPVEELKTSAKHAHSLGLDTIPLEGVLEDHKLISEQLQKLAQNGYTHLAWAVVPKDLKAGINEIKFYGLKQPPKFRWKEASHADIDNWITYFKKVGNDAAAKSLHDQLRHTNERRRRLSEGKIVKNLKFDIKDDDGGYVPCEAEVEIEFSHDANYGADADGNRGVPETFIEDFKVLSASINGDKLYVKYTDKLPAEFQAALENAVGQADLTEAKITEADEDGVELYSDEYNNLIVRRLPKTPFTIGQALEIAKEVTQEIGDEPNDVDEDYVAELLDRQKGITRDNEGNYSYIKTEEKPVEQKPAFQKAQPQVIDYKGYKIQVIQDASRNYLVQVGTEQDLKSSTTLVVGYAGNTVTRYDNEGRPEGKISIEERIQQAKNLIDLFVDGSINQIQAAFNKAKNTGLADYLKKVAKQRQIKLEGVSTGQHRYTFLLDQDKVVAKDGTEKDIPKWLAELGEENVEQIQDENDVIVWPKDKEDIASMSDKSLKAEYEELKVKPKVNKAEILRQNSLLDELDRRNIVVEGKIKEAKGNTQCTKCNHIFLSTPAGKGNCPECSSSDVKIYEQSQENMNKTKIKENTVLGVDFGKKIDVEKADCKPLQPGVDRDKDTNVKMDALAKQLDELMAKVDGMATEIKKKNERIEVLQKNYAKDVVGLTESLEVAQKSIVNVNEAFDKIKIENKVIRELSEERKSKIDEQTKIINETKKVSTLNETKAKSLEEKYNKEIKKLTELHTLELVKKYGQALIEARGLKLNTRLKTLFEHCKTEAEVRAFLREAVEIIRSDMQRPTTPLTEIKVTEKVDEPQLKLNNSISSAFEGMGGIRVK